MALSKGKKVLIAIVGAVVTIGAVIGTVFAVKKIKENVEMTDRPGITTPVNPGQNEGQEPGQGDEGQKPGQDEGQKPGQDEGQKPGEGDEGQDPGQDDEEQGGGDEGQQGGGDDGSGGNPGGGGDETPEISEEEYRQDNIEALKEILASEYNEFSLGKYVEYELTNISDLKINKTTGSIYFRADRKNIRSSNPNAENLLFEGNFVDENGEPVIINCQTQEEFNKFLNQNYNMVFEFGAPMISQISETTYDKFVDYVKEQRCDGVDFSAASDNDVFGITWFLSDPSAYGNRYIEYKIAKDNQVYTIHLENTQPLGSNDSKIEELMTYKNSVFKIVDVQPFEEFDISTVITGEAEEGGYVLDLSEVPISKAEAASLAFDIWSLNPEKDMDVILPANDSGLEIVD